MGLFDFLFGNKKAEQERLRLEEEARLKRIEQERIRREKELQLEAARKKEQERKRAVQEAASSITPFVFKSNCHQRYQNGEEVMGLQQCGRTVRVEKNTNGCPGYKLNPGDGYIVKIYNDDLGKPNMSDKPMRVVSKSATKVELRGFPIEAQSPFGWQEVDYRDYGFTIYYTNGTVTKCVLHMFDRNVDLEYRRHSNKNNNNEASTKQAPQTERNSTKNVQEKSIVETLSEQALTKLQMGMDGDEVYHPLYKVWREIQNSPSLLKGIINKASVGMGLFVFISYGTVSDIDDRQQILSLSYLLISEAIANKPQDINLVKNRLLVMLQDKEAFQYTVSSVVNKDESLVFMNLSPFKSRDALFKMIYADLSKSTSLRSIPQFNQAYIDINTKIVNNFFGQNKSPNDIISEGNKHHQEILSFLQEKVLQNEDIDF